jgi:hypothetical protein
MKTISGIIVLLLVCAGCGSDEPQTQVPAAKPESSMETDQDLYTRAAANLVDQFGGKLKSTLLDALNENGPLYAMQICQMRAPEVIAAHSTEGWEVKRVSEKWRSINDRPDTTELRILSVFADPNTQDDYLIRWSGDDSTRMFHYYKEIRVSRLCLQCHGDIQTVDLNLWKETRIAYPYDKATGYKEGDLRGMFVVNAAWPEGKDIAQLLVDGAEMTELSSPDTTAVDLPDLGTD